MKLSDEFADICTFLNSFRIFIAQLWKYDDENEMLENHKGKWNGRKDIKSYIPKEGEEGNIENDYCHVLGTVIY